LRGWSLFDEGWWFQLGADMSGVLSLSAQPVDVPARAASGSDLGPVIPSIM
jgi:hypothetical protein